MTAKKPHHETKHEHDSAAKDVSAVDASPPEPGTTPQLPVVSETPVPRPTAVGGIGTFVTPPTSDDLTGIVAAAVASGGPCSIIVTNESDAQAVRNLLKPGKNRPVIKVKPKQSVRAMWRSIPG